MGNFKMSKEFLWGSASATYQVDREEEESSSMNRYKKIWLLLVQKSNRNKC